MQVIMIQHKTVKLMQKGTAADICDTRQCTVSITWTRPAVFDAAAVWEDKKGNTGIVWHGNTGNSNIFPHICMLDVCCLREPGPNAEEVFLIYGPFLLKYIWILCWDSEKIQKGLPAEFKESNILVTIQDHKGNLFEIHPDNDAPANTALLATIDNSRLLEQKIINNSHAGMFNELKNLEQLMAFIREGHNAVPSSIYKFSI